MHGSFLPIRFHVVALGQSEVCERNQGDRQYDPEQVKPCSSVPPSAEYFPTTILCFTLLIALDELLMFNLVGLGEIASTKFGV